MEIIAHLIISSRQTLQRNFNDVKKYVIKFYFYWCAKLPYSGIIWVYQQHGDPLLKKINPRLFFHCINPFLKGAIFLCD